MGGGGAIRAAAKVVGISAASGGIRITAAGRGLASSRNGFEEVDSVQKIDEWEFAGGEEEFSGDSTARIVFGGSPPSIEETQAVCSELSDALQRTYLSPKSAEWNGSLISDENSASQMLSESESVNLETKVSVTCSAKTVAPLVPKQALQAFKLFNQSPAVQSIVASIASDAKVWNAVMQNPELVEFLNSYHTNGYLSTKEKYVLDNGFQPYQTPNDFNESSDVDESHNQTWLADSLSKVRTAMVDMMNNLSNFFESLFGGQSRGEVSAGSDKVSVVDMAVGASFVGLAIMVVMIVVLKRG